MSHHHRCFRAALSALAGHGHIKQRLITAFGQHLSDIDESTLPLTAREPFIDLRQKMTRVSPLNGEGPICASVRKMSIVDASACSEALVALYADVIRYGEPDVAEPDSLAAESAAKVPTMLLKSV